MRKKFLAIVLVAAMVLSLAACGKEPTSAPATPTTAPTNTPTPTKAPVPAVEGGEASIDFEDGAFAFAKVFEGGRLAEMSKLSVNDVNGSKVLFAQNMFMKPETYIGFDLDALLGDKIADVKTIKFDVGVGNETFYAISGVTTLYTGEDAATKTKADWAVYVANKSPKTVTVDVKNAFTANAKNYMVISKNSDAPYEDASHENKTSTIGVSFYLDNIKFLDKDGKLIEANKAAVVSADALFNQSEETGTVLYGKKCINNTAYQGDWTVGNVVPAGFFEGATGPLGITLDIAIENPSDYCNIFVAGSDWTKPNPNFFVDLPVGEGTYAHVQLESDTEAALIIDDKSLTQVHFVITKEAADFYAAHGGMGFPGHNVQVISTTVCDNFYQSVCNTTYQGDWTVGAVVPAAFFEGITDNFSVTLDIAVENPSDYCNIFVAGSDWTKPNPNFFVDLPVGEGTYAHVQLESDTEAAFILDDKSLTQVSFVMTKEAAEFYATHGGMGFPGHNLQVINASISKDTYQKVCNTTYQGDWTVGEVIPAAFFEGITGNFSVTLDIAVENPSDYCNIFVAGSDWTKPNPNFFVDLPVGEGTYAHVQLESDTEAALILDDKSLTQVHFVMTKEAAEFYATHGGMGFPGHNLQVINATIRKNTFEKVCNTTYQGDWTVGEVIPAGFFEGITGNFSITLDIAIENPSDYCNVFVAGSDWTKPNPNFFVGLPVGEGTYAHVQLESDTEAALIVDDKALTQVNFVMTKEAAEFYATHGGMGFPGHNVQVISATITK